MIKVASKVAMASWRLGVAVASASVGLSGTGGGNTEHGTAGGPFAIAGVGGSVCLGASGAVAVGMLGSGWVASCCVAGNEDSGALVGEGIWAEPVSSGRTAATWAVSGCGGKAAGEQGSCSAGAGPAIGIMVRGALHARHRSPSCLTSAGWCVF